MTQYRHLENGVLHEVPRNSLLFNEFRGVLRQNQKNTRGRHFLNNDFPVIFSGIFGMLIYELFQDFLIYEFYFISYHKFQILIKFCVRGKNVSRG